MTTTTDYFKAGGTLHRDAPSYVRRASDDELFEQICAGQFCYVLTTRQMGKSSLMIRTADRLRLSGARVAVIDLSALGTRITADQWYLGIVRRMADQLKVGVNTEEWWAARSALGSVQRLSDFVEQVVLPGVAGPIVVFLDEIDSTLGLDFTDDFFAAIRVFYNQRASTPAYDRLTFVLLGVAAPSDLIKDRNRTPFNIGRAVALREFSRAETAPLARGLDLLFPGRGDRILDRVFHWTGGQPYLTQRLCLELSEQPERPWDDAEVDRLVDRLFFSENAEPDSNLSFVRSYIQSRPERAQLLEIYRRVYRDEAVLEDERSPYQNRLKLVGLVRSAQGSLRVRNEIYRRVFGPAFIKEQMPRNWTPLIVGAAAAVVALALALIFFVSSIRAEQTRAANLENVAGLCGVAASEGQASFFGNRTPAEQLDMFQIAPGAADASLIATAACVAPAIAAGPLSPPQQDELRAALCAALARREGLDAATASSAAGCQ